MYMSGQERSVRLLAGCILVLCVLIGLACSGCLYDEQEANGAPCPVPKKGGRDRMGHWSPVGTWIDSEDRAVCTFYPDGSYSEIYGTTSYVGTWWMEDDYPLDKKMARVSCKSVNGLASGYELKFRRQLGRDDLLAMCNYCPRMYRRK